MGSTTTTVSTTPAQVTTTTPTTTTTTKATTTTPTTTSTTPTTKVATTTAAPEWSKWSQCSAACGNGEEKRTRGVESESRLCHIKLCSREKWLLSMVVPGEALPMVLHASESGDLFLLKLMLYQ